jgi:transglutaminase-like putative cysteine protease
MRMSRVPHNMRFLTFHPKHWCICYQARYCEVDSELADFAWANFNSIPSGWSRVQAICDFVHAHLKFDYQQEKATRTALDAFRDRVGVCRDFTHLAITLCRCMNIPARYVTGYLGDIGVPPVPDPMDFSAWMEVYLGGRWFTFDPRHNRRRIGRIVIARGRDAIDVAITTVFGKHTLAKFLVNTEEGKDNDALEVQTNASNGDIGKETRRGMCRPAEKESPERRRIRIA